MPTRMDFDLSFARSQPLPAAKARQDGPMRVLIMGDFSARANQKIDAHGLDSRGIEMVDTDNIDAVMSRLAPRLTLPLAADGPDVVAELQTIDDFHPDRLYPRLDIFQSLRQTRHDLLNPDTFAETAARLTSGRDVATKAEGGSSGAGQDAGQGAPEDQATMFDRLLGKGPTAASSTPIPGTRQTEGIERFIQRIVAPYIVPEADPQQQQLVTSVDEATSAQMRTILHHPDFQALESGWRAVYWLISELEIGEDLHLYLIDVTKAELMEDLVETSGDLSKTGLFRLLVEKHAATRGGQPWSALVGNYCFDNGEEDVALLAALGATASHAGGPFIAAASPTVFGCESLLEYQHSADWNVDTQAQERWQRLRQHSAAGWLGLAVPRFLLRLPYGRKTDEVDCFAFEEWTPASQHATYLWGNSAFACAMLIARSYTDNGWSMTLGDQLQIGDLPAHVYEKDGESMMKPCAEVYLSDKSAESILQHGVMPLLSDKSRNAIHLSRFQSLTHPARSLLGPWS